MPLHEAVRTDLSAEESIGLVYPTYCLDAPLAIKALVPKLQPPAAGRGNHNEGFGAVNSRLSVSLFFLKYSRSHPRVPLEITVEIRSIREFKRLTYLKGGLSL